MNLLLRLAGVVIGSGALGCAGLALAALGGRFSPRLDILTHFAPIYFAGGVLGVLLAAALEPTARSIAAAGGLVAILASGTLMAPEVLARLAARDLPPAEGDLKLIQFNAWGGNRKSEQAIEWLLRQHADILVIEEPGKVQYELVRRGGYHLNCGNCFAAILSKAPPTWSNTPANWRIEPPVVSIATFSDARGPFTVMGAHRHWPSRVRVLAGEMSHLKGLVSRYPRDDLIVAGDFNSTPWSFARRREDRDLGLTRRTRALFSWPAEKVSHNRLPAPFPVLPIDHVYAGPGWLTVRVERGPRLGSDHYPVVVVLRRKPPVAAVQVR